MLTSKHPSIKHNILANDPPCALETVLRLESQMTRWPWRLNTHAPKLLRLMVVFLWIAWALLLWIAWAPPFVSQPASNAPASDRALKAIGSYSVCVCVCHCVCVFALCRHTKLNHLRTPNKVVQQTDPNKYINSQK